MYLFLKNILQGVHVAATTRANRRPRHNATSPATPNTREPPNRRTRPRIAFFGIPTGPAIKQIGTPLRHWSPKVDSARSDSYLHRPKLATFVDPFNKFQSIHGRPPLLPPPSSQPAGQPPRSYYILARPHGPPSHLPALFSPLPHLRRRRKIAMAMPMGKKKKKMALLALLVLVVAMVPAACLAVTSPYVRPAAKATLPLLRRDADADGQTPQQVRTHHQRCCFGFGPRFLQ